MKKCPDCNGELEQGAMLDFSHGAILAERYAKAVLPEDKNSFNGMKVVETDFTDLRRVQALRCIKCNRIFLYAQDIVLNKNITTARNGYVIAFFIGIVLLMLIAITMIVIGH